MSIAYGGAAEKYSFAAVLPGLMVGRKQWRLLYMGGRMVELHRPIKFCFAKPFYGAHMSSTQHAVTSGEVKSTIRVLLVDDHRTVLWGLRKLIDGEAPRMAVVAEATCWQELLDGLKHDPDVILLELDLAEENALDMVAQLRERSPAKVIILTGLRDAETCDQAIMQGAWGLVHKWEPDEAILKAISHVYGGELCVDSSTAARVFASFSANGKRSADASDSGGEQLTDTQLRVVAAVVKHRGAPAKVIADAMHISRHTLRNHLASIYEKLGVHRRLDLVLYAMEAGLDKQGVRTRPGAPTKTRSFAIASREFVASKSDAQHS